jgi:meiosis induction protein kinase IME2/SME1
MWDPKNRPTSTQALSHEYFADAVDPLRPKSSTTKLLGRKQSDRSFKTKETVESPTLSSKPSWFRRSLIVGSGRDSPAPLLEQDEVKAAAAPPAESNPVKVKSKRATWANGAPMPILPSIRPVSPLSNAVTAQASSTLAHAARDHANASRPENGKMASKKIGRQLSVNSNGNHYADIHRQEAERALNGGGTIASPVSGQQKESFFAHLRKRARRLSGRNQATALNDDVEANAANVGWSNRSSMIVDLSINTNAGPSDDFSELDKALQSVRYNDEVQSKSSVSSPKDATAAYHLRQSIPRGVDSGAPAANAGHVTSRTRRPLQLSTRPAHRYETPEEEEELLHEVLHSTTQAARRLGQYCSNDEPSRKGSHAQLVQHNPYPTPSPSSKRDNVSFVPVLQTPSKPTTLRSPIDKETAARQWPTPPYDDNQWASTATASIFAAAGSTYR